MRCRWCCGRRRARLWGRAARCARGRRPAREPSAQRASLGASARSPARPRRRPPAPRPGPPVPPAPSTPVALALRGVAWCVVSKPGQSPPPPSNFARNSPATLSNIEFRSLELQRFQTLLKLYPIELRATFLGSCLIVVVMSRAVPFWCSVGSCWFEMLRARCCGVVCGLCLVRTWASWLKEMSPRRGCVVGVVKETSPLHGENGRILGVYGVLGR